MNERLYYVNEKSIKGLIEYSASVWYRDYQNIRMMVVTFSICLLISCATALWLGNIKNYTVFYTMLFFGIIFFIIYLVAGFKRNLDFFRQKEIKRFNSLMNQAQVIGEIDSIIENIDDMFGTAK